MVTFIFLSVISLASTSDSSYTIVCPRGGGWSSDAAANQTKSDYRDGYVWLNSSTNERKVKFLMKATNGNSGSETSFIHKQNGATLLRNQVQPGDTVTIKAAAKISDAGIYNTTARGSWRSN